MSEVSSVQRSDVRAAIARAAAATGVDFDFLLAQAKIESDLEPNAKAGTSSAAGLYQFVGGTWLETLDRHADRHGIGWADAAISRSGGRATVSDPAARAEIMALRYDPNVSALMAAELARDNASDLKSFLGRDPDPSELYLAHFLGSGGARKFLAALQDNPQAEAAALFPAPANANRSIFFDGDRARTNAEVMQVIATKLAGAMEGGAIEGLTTARHASAPQGAYARAASDFADVRGAPRKVSMAETLRATFGAASSPGAAPVGDRIGQAYNKFKAFGL